MGVDDFGSYSKSQPCSIRFICNKRAEDIADLFFSHSAAVILYGNADAGICLTESYGNFSSGMIDCFAGISYQIKYNLTHFNTVQKYIAGDIFYMCFQCDPEII